VAAVVAAPPVEVAAAVAVVADSKPCPSGYGFFYCFVRFYGIIDLENYIKEGIRCDKNKDVYV
jgi:hypothetical protein